ncbi:MAG: DHHA1 domain-containing protein [Candidatus Pacebacteria bacterium]|nr:DHHA1 domain-containing protein [Candidatus Paceibacterota bacterium]
MIVFYHQNCHDGFGSAWAVWKKFKNKAQYFSLNYQSPFHHLIEKDTVYFVDIVPERKILEDLIKKDNKIIIIDHHQSAKNILDLKKFENVEINLNMRRSASVLVWQYFFPKKRIPKLLLYVEDMDLWKFKIPYTREVLATINLNDMDFKKWDKIAKELEDRKGRNKYIQIGKKIIEYQDNVIKEIMQEAKEVKFEKHKTLAVNSSILISELGHALIKKKPPMAIVWFEAGEDKRVSLRSNGKVDVAKIAEKYGGGGHKRAAGFALKNKKPLPWKT